jgi:hypothetical protein
MTVSEIIKIFRRMKNVMWHLIFIKADVKISLTSNMRQAMETYIKGTFQVLVKALVQIVFQWSIFSPTSCPVFT